MLQIDKYGFVEYVEHMGSDERIVDSARRSYGEGTKKVSSSRALIRYMLENGHTSPFESCVITLHVKAPIFVARQWMRHRTASYNELSARYSLMPDEYFVPEYARGQSITNKQGSEGVLEDDGKFVDTCNAVIDFSRKAYEQAIEDGVSRELARTLLPVSQYTDFYFTMNLHNLFRFLALRDHSHAQPEIRVYAQAISEIVKGIFPLAYEAYVDYIKNSVNISGPSLSILKECIDKEKFTKLINASPSLSKGEKLRVIRNIYGDED